MKKFILKWKRQIIVLAPVVVFLSILLALYAGNGQPVPEPEPPALSPTPAPTPASAPSPQASPEEEAWIAIKDRIDGSTATIPLTTAIHQLFGNAGDPPEHRTTSWAYDSLIGGSSDLIFVTYPSEDEFEKSREAGAELEIVPVAKDALVFLVNIANPVEDISLSQIRDIYAGRTTNWRKLGGTDESIIPYQRTENSGSQTLLLKLVMEDEKPMPPPSEWIAGDMGGLVESISTYDNSQAAIGYSMFYYVNNMYGNSQFRLLGIDGVIPTRETIISGDYPLGDGYYAVIRKDDADNSPARIIVDWLLTDEGQTVAAQAGYIPVRPIDGVWADDGIDPIYLGDTDNSSGTGGTVWKGPDCVGELVVNGVRKPLSDVFYDGFNYIAYINSEIVNTIQEHRLLYYEYEYNMEKRSFPGIPNNYPNYELIYYGDWSVWLDINFPPNNPFFDPFERFYINLTSDISPYGVRYGDVPSARISYKYQHMGQKMPDVEFFKVSVVMPEAPEAARRINGRLTNWPGDIFSDPQNVAQLKGIVAHGKNNAFWEEEYVNYLRPIPLRYHNYLSISYLLQVYNGGWSDELRLPMLGTITFDLNTGETVDLVKKLPADFDFTRYPVYEPSRFDADGQIEGGGNVGAYGEYDYASGYDFPPGSYITDSWLTYKGLTLSVAEPGGRALRVEISEDELDRLGFL